MEPNAVASYLSLEPRKVLIVEDEEDILDIMSRILRKKFPLTQVEEARHGIEAWEKVQALQPDVILLDLRIPFLSGYELCWMLRQDSRFKNTRILAFTDQDAEKNETAITATGADAFIHKPFTVTSLVTAVAELLDSDSVAKAKAS